MGKREQVTLLAGSNFTGCVVCLKVGKESYSGWRNSQNVLEFFHHCRWENFSEPSVNNPKVILPGELL